MDSTSFKLNIHLVDESAAPTAPTGECTDDNCGSGNTGSEACVTNG